MKISNNINFDQSVKLVFVNSSKSDSSVKMNKYSTLPSVCPAYYSPSFTSNGGRGSFSSSRPVKYLTDMELYPGHKNDRLEEWAVNLSEEKNYSDEKAAFVFGEIADKCIADDSYMPPEYDKGVLDITLAKYELSKEQKSDESFDFEKEYRKEQKLKFWRRYLFSDRAKLRPYDSIVILKAISDDVEPDDIPPLCPEVLTTTLEKQNEKRQRELNLDDKEDFDFLNEYRKELDDYNFRHSTYAGRGGIKFF